MHKFNTNTSVAGQVLVVERAVTDDAPDGQPWPPVLGDGWVLVRAIGEVRTLWRRIRCGS
jgi:hypothetical protein